MNKKMLATVACKEFEADLVLYYYDEIVPVERCRIEEHLTRCRGCRKFVDELRHTLPHLAQRQELPERFWQNYYRETIAKLAEADARSRWWHNLIFPVQTWFAPAFGAMAVVVLALGLLFAKGPYNFIIDRSPAKLPAEIMADRDKLEFFESLDMLEALSQLEKYDGAKSGSDAERSRNSQLSQGTA